MCVAWITSSAAVGCALPERYQYDLVGVDAEESLLS